MLSTGEGIILSAILYVGWQMCQFWWYFQRDPKLTEIQSLQAQIDQLEQKLKEIGIE